LSGCNVDKDHKEHIDAPDADFVQTVRYRFPRRLKAVENACLPLIDPYSSVESAVFGCLEFGSGLAVSPAATFSTGSLLIGSQVNRGNGSPLALLAS